MSKVNLITDTQRLEELTEWCRNKPDEVAMRIMVAEGHCEPVGAYPRTKEPEQERPKSHTFRSRSTGGSMVVEDDRSFIIAGIKVPGRVEGLMNNQIIVYGENPKAIKTLAKADATFPLVFPDKICIPVCHLELIEQGGNPEPFLRLKIVRC